MSDKPKPITDWAAWSAAQHARLHPDAPTPEELHRFAVAWGSSIDITNWREWQKRYNDALEVVRKQAIQLGAANARIEALTLDAEPFPGKRVTPYEVTLTDDFGNTKTVTIQYEDDAVRWYVDECEREVHYFFKHQWAKDEAERKAAIARRTRASDTNAPRTEDAAE